jgi:predicted O-linked N-acetylglucosamine transferase (SPINDLY family)
MKLSESCSGSGATTEPFSVVAFFREVIKSIPPEAFVIKFSEIQHKCSPDELQLVIDVFLSGLRKKKPNFKAAKQIIFLSKLLDVDTKFSEMLTSTLSSLNWKDDAAQAEYTFNLIHKFTLPVAHHRSSDLEQVVRTFVSNAESIDSEITHLREPLSDFSRDWAPWQGLFCLAQPRLYRHAMSAFERLAFGLWPKLNYTAPHIVRPPEHSAKKIRIGFTVLDLMPMMSGLTERLDKNIFETVFLRPGAVGGSKVASDWVSRADRTVEYSDTDTYSAINTIAQQELDILISGPSVPQIFFPLMARVAHLQMVLLEPNWTDGITNSDYYISWKIAEPEKFRDFYNTPVSLLRHPPYWIESPLSGGKLATSENTDDKIRERLLNLAPQDRFYICANTPPKIHPEMDELIYRILDKDPTSFMVLLRSEHGAAQPVKARLRENLGKHYERIIFLNTLKREDAHALLSAADCCLDSYPLCGMSSSFDGLMLGVPIVTLPVDIPFGRWTAAIYEYIGVSGLTARDKDEYVDIATRMASDKNWRLAKSNELRAKSARYVESEAGFDEFQHFILQAWLRKKAGLPPANWVDGEWQVETAHPAAVSVA